MLSKGKHKAAFAPSLLGAQSSSSERSVSLSSTYLNRRSEFWASFLFSRSAFMSSSFLFPHHLGGLVCRCKIQIGQHLQPFRQSIQIVMLAILEWQGALTALRHLASGKQQKPLVRAIFPLRAHSLNLFCINQAIYMAEDDIPRDFSWLSLLASCEIGRNVTKRTVLKLEGIGLGD